jgi:parvulin-like peptidyl-prolyl isomerase
MRRDFHLDWFSKGIVLANCWHVVMHHRCSLKRTVVAAAVKSSLALLTLGLLVRCSDRHKDAVVARVDGHPILASTFSRALMDRLKYSSVQVQDTPELRRQTVQDIAARYYFAQKATATHLQVRTEFRKAMQAESTFVILRGLWQEEIGNSLTVEGIPEQELQDTYKKMSTRFHVRHLYADSKQRIDSLYARLRLGESFSSLARSCFRDATLGKEAGDLGTLSWGDFDDLALEEAVFRLHIGQYSPPVESKYGWHILYLENLSYNPVLTEQDYLIHKKSIQNRLWQRTLKQKSDERIKTLMQSKQVRMNVPLIIQLEKEQRQLKNHGLIQFGDATEVTDTPFEHLLGQHGNAVIALYNGGQWTVADFRRFLSTVPAEALHHSLYRSVAMSLRNYFLLQIAQQKKIDQLPYVRQEIDDKREHLLSVSYVAAYADTCTFNEKDERACYNQNKNQFLLDREMDVLEILLASEKEAYRIRSLINSEKDFRHYARQYTLRPGMRAKEGYLGKLHRLDFGKVSEEAFKLKTGMARGPVITSKDGYSLIMVTESHEIYAPYEQVRETIRTMLQEQKRIWARNKLLARYVPEDKLVIEQSLYDLYGQR